MQRVCVFLGSNRGARPEYEQAAVEFGRALARRGLGLVYGGSSVGLMGVLADEVLAGGGEVIGVLPHTMIQREIAHTGLTELVVVDTMHQRKAVMAERCDAVAALPGGLGTMDEFFEALTWAQLGYHANPCGVLNVSGYYDCLLHMLDSMTDQGFVRQEHRNMVLQASTPDELLDALAAYEPKAVGKWFNT